MTAGTCPRALAQRSWSHRRGTNPSPTDDERDAHLAQDHPRPRGHRRDRRPARPLRSGQRRHHRHRHDALRDPLPGLGRTSTTPPPPTRATRRATSTSRSPAQDPAWTGNGSGTITATVVTIHRHAPDRRLLLHARREHSPARPVPHGRSPPRPTRSARSAPRPRGRSPASRTAPLTRSCPPATTASTCPAPRRPASRARPLADDRQGRDPGRPGDGARSVQGLSQAHHRRRHTSARVTDREASNLMFAEAPGYGRGAVMTRSVRGREP